MIDDKLLHHACQPIAGTGTHNDCKDHKAMSDTAPQSKGPCTSRRTVLSMAMQISFGVYLGTGIRNGSATPTTPQPMYAATLGELSRDLVTFDSGLALDPANNSADIPVSGGSDAPDGAVIEARLVAFHDKTDAVVPGSSTAWADVATLAAGDGTWAGTVTGPRNVGTEYRVEARVKGSAAPAARTTNRCRIGHILAIWGQSNESRPFNTQYNPELDEGLWESGAYAGDVTVVKRGGGTDDDSVEGDNSAAVVPVTATNAAGVSPGIVAIANAFSSVRPGEKLLVIANTKNGSGLTETMTTVAEKATSVYQGPAQGRDFDEELALHNAGTNNGATSVGLVFCPGWYASTGGHASAVTVHVKYFLGKTVTTGAKESIAADYGNKPLPRTLVRTFADGSFLDGAGHDLRVAFEPSPGNSDMPDQGGLYDYTKTRFAWSGLNF